MYSNITCYFSKYLNLLLQNYGTKQGKNSWSRLNFNKEVLFPCALSFLKKDSISHMDLHYNNDLLPCDLCTIYNWRNTI